MAPDRDVREVLEQINRLGAGWHAAGSFPNSVINEFFRLSQTMTSASHTMETGCGRSTLLFSHVFPHHEVFTIALNNEEAKGTRFEIDDSYARVRKSPLLNEASTHFILGPTQKTLPSHNFEHDFDLVLLDGPHSYPFVELEYFFVYTHIKPGGYLIIDDIWIPTIYNMFCFLKEDNMFHLEKVVENTAFFTRTQAPLFPPYEDHWEAQAYNSRRFPIQHQPVPPTTRLRRAAITVLPASVKAAVKAALKKR